MGYLDNKEFKEFKRLKNKKNRTPEEEQAFKLLKEKKDSKLSDGANDAKWYTAYNDLIENACEFPFNVLAGTGVNVGQYASRVDVMPGCVRVEYLQTPGVNTKATDAWNYQMRNLWLTMHRKYRGMGGYECADLGITIYALIDVYRTVAKLDRVYGCLNKFSTLNRNFPQTIFDALNVEMPAFTMTGSAKDAIADFRYKLNRQIARIKQLCLPKGIHMMAEAVSKQLAIFADSDNVRSALFLYDTAGYYVYEPTTYTGGGSLHYVPFSKSGVNSRGAAASTLDDLIDDLDRQIDILLTDSDITRMCSDLLAAYPDSEFTTMEPVPETFMVTPVHDEQRKIQFHNTTIIPGEYLIQGMPQSQYLDWDSKSDKAQRVLDIFQRDNVIYHDLYLSKFDTVGTAGPHVTDDIWAPRWDGVFTARSGTYPSDTPMVGKYLLDTYIENVTLDDRVEMTANVTTVSVDDRFPTDDPGYALPLGYRAGIVISVTPFVNSSINGITEIYPIEASYVGQPSISYKWLCIFNLMKCDWHPILYTHRGTTVAQYSNVTFRPLADLDNMAVVDYEIINRIHDASCLSLWKIGNIAAEITK